MFNLTDQLEEALNRLRSEHDLPYVVEHMLVPSLREANRQTEELIDDVALRQSQGRAQTLRTLIEIFTGKPVE